MNTNPRNAGRPRMKPEDKAMNVTISLYSDDIDALIQINPNCTQAVRELINRNQQMLQQLKEIKK